MRLFITYDAPGLQWQLGSPPPDPAAFALIGWADAQDDGGVPAWIVDVLASSLAAFGRVTFACSTISVADASGWQMQGPDFVARYRIRSALGRMVARLSARAPADLKLMSTTAAQKVRRLFSDAGYPWWNQAQFALMSAAGAPPPDFDAVDLADLFAREWPDGWDRLQSLGVQAMLRPGVDGDVAGLLCASREFSDRFEAVLARSADAFGVSLRHVGELAFAAALAASPPHP